MHLFLLLLQSADTKLIIHKKYSIVAKDYFGFTLPHLKGFIA